MAKDLTEGTTGTGLDTIVAEILDNPGLSRSISGDDIQGGARAADKLNQLILEAIAAGDLFKDGLIDIDDVRAINAYIRDPAHKARYESFVELHGDDEGGMEWGYHLVQNDGGNGYLEARNLINTVFDGIYHVGFEIRDDDRVVNEDGDANASLQELSHWLTYYLSGGESHYVATGAEARADGRELDDTLHLGAGNDRGNGGAGDDVLYGGGGDDALNGGSGDDRLIGAAGNDSLNGSDGDDVLTGGDGDDELTGSYGNDKLRGNAGADVLRGDDGRDVLAGGSGDDKLYGGEANDRLRGDSGSDYLAGDGGDDKMAGNGGGDTLSGGSGNDKLAGGGGDDTLYGGYDNDKLLGGSGADTLLGGYGHDRVFGGEDGDTIYGEDGDDTLYGEGGDDELKGGYGDDTLDGGAGADVLYGEYGDDMLIGGAGDDYLDGGEGSNRLIGGLGDDTFRANIGTDTFLFEKTAFGDDHIERFNGADGDRIVLDAGVDYSIGINTATGTPTTVLTLSDAKSGAVLGTVTLTDSLFASSDIVTDPLLFG